MVLPKEMYEYVPLPAGYVDRHITRVLQLLPDANLSAPVRCELEQVSLDGEAII
jgi:hypothetical protein